MKYVLKYVLKQGKTSTIRVINLIQMENRIIFLPLLTDFFFFKNNLLNFV